MATVSIHYTSQSEGITIGVHGSDWMECLLRLEDEFGDGVMPLYEKTRDEMRQLFEAVGETFAEEVTRAKELQRSRRAPTQPELVADTGEGGGEADEEDADGGAGSGDSAESDVPVCSICATPVTPDFARAMQIMHGAVRCKDCTA